jgi:AraC-like DNA-binding protein
MPDGPSVVIAKLIAGASAKLNQCLSTRSVSGDYGQTKVKVSVVIGPFMVNNGQSTMSVKTKQAYLEQLNYRASGSYPLDLEIVSVSDLRQRVGPGFLRSTHRYRFHMLLCVTRGACTHMIDFKLIACKPGSLLAASPTQAHRFGFEQGWDGWVVLFRPEFLLSSQATVPVTDLRLTAGLERMPEHLCLQEHERRVVTGAIVQMRKDCRIEAPPEHVHALLRHQLYALLLRLTVLHGRQQAQESTTSVGLQRFRNFQRLVEKKFWKCHGLAEYADLLGCSEKSLTRAAMEVAGVKAKAFIASRINLEAKRLLAHTALLIALIGERLGFQDPTNFVKFFKREVGCTPGEFRRRQAEVDASMVRKARAALTRNA